jgi:NAD(P)-dependent dehydrogenase (short-subunit alcohol dehydrogenase family)
VFEWWECDMADLSSLEALAARWNETGRPLDILCNNAGMSPRVPRVETRDGFELCHQVNFLSHTLLTLSVLPSIARAKSPRIICTTSCLHYMGKCDLSNANAGGPDAYQNNKLYFQMWLTELQVRMLRNPDYHHVVVHGVHPGFVGTGIWVGVPKYPSSSILKGLLGWFGIDSKQGSLTIINAATAAEASLQVAEGEEGPENEFKGGAKYFNRTWEDEPNPYVRSAAHRKKLWDFILDELKVGERSGVSTDLFD